MARKIGSRLRLWLRLRLTGSHKLVTLISIELLSYGDIAKVKESVKNDHRSKFSISKEEAWKNQGFNGIRARDLREYRWDALSTELGQFTEFISSHEEWNDVKYTWNILYLNCGCKWKWKLIIALNFPI